jgi:hypothetical protein
LASQQAQSVEPQDRQSAGLFDEHAHWQTVDEPAGCFDLPIPPAPNPRKHGSGGLTCTRRYLEKFCEFRGFREASLVRKPVMLRRCLKKVVEVRHG